MSIKPFTFIMELLRGKALHIWRKGGSKNSQKHLFIPLFISCTLDLDVDFPFS